MEIFLPRTRRLAPSDYLPDEPLKALWQLWENEDMNNLICDELMNWSFIALTTVNAITDHGDPDFLKTQGEFVAFYSELLPLIEASCGLCVGAKAYEPGGKWPDADAMWGLMRESKNCLFLFSSLADIENPFAVMRRFCGQKDYGSREKLLWKWFQAVEEYEGPFKEKLSGYPSWSYESVLVILKSVYLLTERFPEAVGPWELLEEAVKV